MCSLHSMVHICVWQKSRTVPKSNCKPYVSPYGRQISVGLFTYCWLCQYARPCNLTCCSFAKQHAVNAIVKVNWMTKANGFLWHTLCRVKYACAFTVFCWWYFHNHECIVKTVFKTLSTMWIYTAASFWRKVHSWALSLYKIRQKIYV